MDRGRSTESSPFHSTFWSSLLMIVVVVLIGYAMGLTRLPLVGEETSRALHGIEMARSGDWLVATNHGVPILDRPPMHYWILALVHRWVHPLDPFTLRLSMVIVTLTTSLLIWWYARGFLSPPGAFLAAVAYPTMGHVFDLGRRVESDGLFTLFLAGALMVWHYGFSRQRPLTWTWVGGTVLAALATLTKGLQAPFVFFGTVYLFLMIRRDRETFFRVSHLIGLVLFVLLIAVWQVPFYLETGWEGTRETWLDPGTRRLGWDSLKLFAHMATFPLETFGAALPWSILLIGLCFPRFWQHGDQIRSAVVFLLLGMLLTFLPVWVSVGGQPRYIMPMYPLMAVLCGAVVQQALAAGVAQRLGLVWTYYARFMAIMIIAFVVFFVGVTLTGWFSDARGVQLLVQPWSLLLVLAVAAAGGTVVIFRKADSPNQRDAILLAFAIAALVASCFNSVIVNINAGKAADLEPAVAALRRSLPADAQLVSFEPLHHKFVYWYGKPIPILRWPATPEEVPDHVIYFAMDVSKSKKHRRRELPFDWEPIAELNMDKLKTEDPFDRVVVGRRIEDEVSNAQR